MGLSKVRGEVNGGFLRNCFLRNWEFLSVGESV